MASRLYSSDAQLKEAKKIRTAAFQIVNRVNKLTKSLTQAAQEVPRVNLQTHTGDRDSHPLDNLRNQGTMGPHLRHLLRLRQRLQNSTPSNEMRLPRRPARVPYRPTPETRSHNAEEEAHPEAPRPSSPVDPVRAIFRLQQDLPEDQWTAAERPIRLQLRRAQAAGHQVHRYTAAGEVIPPDVPTNPPQSTRTGARRSRRNAHPTPTEPGSGRPQRPRRPKTENRPRDNRPTGSRPRKTPTPRRQMGHLPRRTPLGFGLPEIGLFFPILLFLSMMFGRTNALVGYDCSGERLNVTTVSLTEVGKCAEFQDQVNVTSQRIQLIQLSDYDTTHVMHCKIIIDRTVRYCGVSGAANYDVAYGCKVYVYEPSWEQCNALHKFNRTTIWGLETGVIAQNSTTYIELNPAGWTSNDGYCGGAHWDDAYGSWDSVYVRAKLQIQLRDYRATVKLNEGKIVLESGTRCNLKDGKCIDPILGHTFYDSNPRTDCGSHYRSIAVTFANKTVSQTNDKVVYVAEMKELAFALTRGRVTEICGVYVYRTEHEKLLIAELNGSDDRRLVLRGISEEDVNIATYLNSKMVHLNYHWERQMTMMYADILRQECELERKVLEQSLILATVAPDEMAKAIMKEPGYMAVIAGEVAHLVRCIPVEVAIRHVEECYQELAVQRGNDTFFLSARTRILRKTGTQIPCSPIIPQMFDLGGNWYKIAPKPVAVLPPNTLKPTTTKDWVFEVLIWLARGGVYTIDEVNRMIERIMFPMERDATLSNLASGVTGHHVVPQGTNYIALFEGEGLNMLAKSILDRAWGGFISFGTASAGVLGLFLCIRAVKLIIDTAIHGFALHRVYGFSLYLLGAIWDSVTNLLLHLGRYSTERERLRGNRLRGLPSGFDDDVEAGVPLNRADPATHTREASQGQEQAATSDTPFSTPNPAAGTPEPTRPQGPAASDMPFSPQSPAPNRVFTGPPVVETPLATFQPTQTSAPTGALNGILKSRADGCAGQMTPITVRRTNAPVTPVTTPKVHRKAPANPPVEYSLPKGTPVEPPLPPKERETQSPQASYANVESLTTGSTHSPEAYSMNSQGHEADPSTSTYMNMDPLRTVSLGSPTDDAASHQPNPNRRVTFADPLGASLTWTFPQSNQR